MPAGFFVQDQPSDDQRDDRKEDQDDHDRSDIRLYPGKHSVSAPFVRQ